ncbi:MAG: IS630 family transposase [Gammaproteobacteria bacterium]|nr:IS630 family transposase [Gammaproteobacteria bacterium]
MPHWASAVPTLKCCTPTKPISTSTRIGYAWQPQGEQLAVPTPGINRKHYVAGALHAETGKIVWTFHPRKNTDLFIAPLKTLRRTYRRARSIVLIADNHIIHKSRKALKWLKANPKFTVVFQPAWHPWVNEIEKLWRQMHETVTRNHRCRVVDELLCHVDRFLYLAQPFLRRGPRCSTIRSSYLGDVTLSRRTGRRRSRRTMPPACRTRAPDLPILLRADNLPPGPPPKSKETIFVLRDKCVPTLDGTCAQRHLLRYSARRAIRKIMGAAISSNYSRARWFHHFTSRRILLHAEFHTE